MRVFKLILIVLCLGFFSCSRFYFYRIINKDANVRSYACVDSSSQVKLKITGTYRWLINTTVISHVRIEVENNSNLNLSIDSKKPRLVSHNFDYDNTTSEYVLKIPPGEKDWILVSFWSELVNPFPAGTEPYMPKDEKLVFYFDGFQQEGVQLIVEPIEFVPEINLHE